MSRLDAMFSDFNGLFTAVPMPKHPLDDEQAAPFTAPTDAEIARMREGVDAIKRRNAEASPTTHVLKTHEGVSL